MVVGLMSGTSIDGIDCALVEIEGSGLNTKVNLLKFYNHPISLELKRDILKACSITQSSVELICRLNFKIGEEFAEAVLKICELVGINCNDVDLIGSHGQTIYHIPQNSTLQMGEASVIAEKTGIAVVADFRVRDVAAGGHGAPLVPYTEYLLYRNSYKTIALQNIGGIGNVTVIPKGCGINEVYAFDTGPGNMMIDAIVEKITNGKMRFDEEGKLASKGKINTKLLSELMLHPFIIKNPPKTTGREEFGLEYSEKILEKYLNSNVSESDIINTVTYFTATSICENYRKFILLKHDIDEVIISGGGTYNKTLIRMIKEELKGINVLTQEDIGLSSEAKEAVAFAILANEAIHGNANNLPNVTEANKSVVMGKIMY
ncbi:MAG: anhydro-N-acetylmuramic acid kinase [Clostridiales bacterium]|nr:anhydro-N-acetylmuramic acid kinase [Clostridiales bacterium]